jgi:1,4-dihydroxy-2-naphthoate octaprenyltransferase
VIEMLRLTRPLHLVLASLTYAMGAAIADYLGASLAVDAFWLGLAIVVLAQACTALLGEVFRPANEPILADETPALRRDRRNQGLYLSLAALTVLVGLGFALFLGGRLSAGGVVFTAVVVVLPVVYAVPPLRVVNRGFGEFVLSIQLASAAPTLAFLLQAQEYHRLLGLTVVPITVIALAYFLVMDFPTFAVDQKYERRSLLRLLGWERAVPFHHGLLGMGYALFALAGLLGFPLTVLWPAFITLPFALLQMNYLRNIALGARPNWTLLTANALAVFVLTVYFLTLTFYLR